MVKQRTMIRYDLSGGMWAFFLLHILLAAHGLFTESSTLCLFIYFYFLYFSKRFQCLQRVGNDAFILILS